MIVDTAKMSARGQIVIPKDMREQLGALEDTVLTLIAPGDGTITLKPLDRARMVKEFQELRAKTKKVNEQFILDEIAASRAERRRPGHERDNFDAALAKWKTRARR